MKTIKTWLTMIAVLLCSIKASAQSFMQDGLEYTILSSAEKTVSVKYGETMPIGDLVIPAAVTNDEITYSVTSIGELAFCDCNSLTSITIPESVTSIGSSAFEGCSSLTAVHISSIEAWCKISFSGNVSNPLYYAHNLYLNGELVTKLIIPEGVTSILDYAFYGCSSLASITLPEGVTSILEYAFIGCSSLTAVHISSIEAWCKISFSGFGSNPLYYAHNLYLNGELVTKLIIPEGVTSILDYAFYGCSSLTSITIPESVASIGNSAFSDCSSLTSITIPESVASIGSSAFERCSSLTAVHISSIEAWCKISFSGIGSNPLCYAHNLYLNGELVTKLIIPEGVTSILDYAFSDCSSLTSITLPEGVTSILDYAFYGCSSLTSINIPKSVTSIGTCAFRDCDLISISIPESVTEIRGEITQGCHNLSEVIFNASYPYSVDLLSVLGDGMCSVKTLYIGKNVQGISRLSYCTDGCNWGNLECLIVDEANPVLDSRNNCNAIIETSTNKLIMGSNNTVIPSDVTSIADKAFAYLKKLNSITIPNLVIEIIPCSFETSSLSKVYIPSSVEKIYYASFMNCSNLKSITCDAAVPPTVVHPSGIPSQYGAFSGVPLDECVLYVPENAIEAYQTADVWCEFVNIQAIAKEVDILDASETFVQNKDEECASISYIRTFNNTNWQALYVPFEIPVTEEFLADFEVADLNDVRQYDRDEDGVKDETVIEAFKVTNGVLEANYPYLIRAKEAGEKTITVTEATLYATEENSIDCSSIREKFTFTGTYSRLSSEELPQGEGYYALSGGVWQPVAEGASLGAFRFYLKVDSRDGLNAGQSNAIRMRIIGENGEEDGTTGIANSEFKIQNSELIYDLQGRRVEKPTKGVYIVNGVKRVF